MLGQLANDFKQLTTKVKKDHIIKNKQFSKTFQVLEACQNEYKKIYSKSLELKKKFKEKDKQIIIARKKIENTSQQPMPTRQKKDKQLKLSDTDIDKIIKISRKKIKNKKTSIQIIFIQRGTKRGRGRRK